MLSKIGAIAQTDFGLQHSWALGSSMEMILFSIALGNRINALKRENEMKQKVVIRQLEENRKLQTKVNRELEEKVVERTKEIYQQNQEIVEQRKTLQAEKNRSDRLLQNILPMEIAEELKQKGHATPRLYNQVSILFVDIKGFSMMVSDISPGDLVKDLDYCFTGFDYIITQHNLEKIKTIGDAYLCVGGLPSVNETHAHDAVAAALEMLKFIEKWQSDNPALGQKGLTLRIGINSGSVIAGVVGKKKFQYDIWGEAVNLASRMETSGEAGKINISQSTFDLVKNEYDCEYRGKMSIKNMGDVDMYFVGGKKP
ncbi:MAG: hypothetical protein HKN76_09785 [Saprospiraceae bacterium]|nr:hypothetical protein [Saprospiraceae bacterium]